MISTRTALRLAFAALGLSAAAPARAAPAPHLALVIGSSAYAAMPALPDCAASSHVLSAALRRAGFDVTEKLDLSNGQMGGAIGALADALGRAPGATAVVYVCGYVAGLEGRAFLLPVSANLERDTDALTQGIAAKSLFDLLVRSGAGSGLVLIDAQPRPGGTGPLGLDKLTERPPEAHVALAAATTAGQPQGPTPFAMAVAGAFAAPAVEADALLDELRRKLGAGSATTLAALPAAERTWLVGGPPAPATRAEPPAALVAPSPAPVPAVTPAPRAAPPVVLPDEERMTDPERRQVQGALQALGYYDGAVDGIFGPDTRAAIRRWQHEIGADMTGRITSDQATRLLARRH